MKLTRKLTTLLLTITLILGTAALPAAAAGTLPFPDVARSDWFYAPVQFCYDNGVMSGVSATEFAPNAAITRAMLVTMLHRLSGSPAPAQTTGFSDVPAGEWYTKPVYWAKENGVVSGYPDGTFGPDRPITRAELVVVLYGYARKIEGKDVSGGTELTFADTADIGAWAQTAVAWAVANKIVSGKPGNLFDPQGGATRAEGATILQRYIDPGYKPPADPLAAYEFPYDVAAIIADAKAYGASIGGVWIDELDPDNCAWEAPGHTYATWEPAELKKAYEGRIARIKTLHDDNHPGADEFYFKLLFVPWDGHPGEYEVYFLMG
ncbi:MAG: S-layer homology domain-containing protein [Oscillospiraceae bacterium]|nr:S-layer homology domain-containing protein [Oscillospiraceae bacterium]